MADVCTIESAEIYFLNLKASSHWYIGTSREVTYWPSRATSPVVELLTRQSIQSGNRKHIFVGIQFVNCVRYRTGCTSLITINEDLFLQVILVWS
jgi:hypothetical protein